MTKETREIGLGVAGCGDFGNFVINAMKDVDDVRIVAVFDTDPTRAAAAASACGAEATHDYTALLAHSNIDLVALCTPPSVHAVMAAEAITAGKNVFCEKPLAITLENASELIRTSRARDVMLAVDYVMRWNPIYWLLRRLQALRTASGPVLGPLRHYGLENHAADERVLPSHWFWDPTVSGGIFVEHGVHFFDACQWLAETTPTAVQAVEMRRDGTDTIDTAIATALHPNGMTATYLHAFTHADGTEYQNTILDWGFAHGTINGWIPLDLDMELWTDDAGKDAVIAALAPEAKPLEVPGYRFCGEEEVRVKVLQHYPEETTWTGRREPRNIRHRLHIKVSMGGEIAKKNVYQATIRAGVLDIVNAVRDKRPLLISDVDVWTSLATAIAAREAALNGTIVKLAKLPADLRQQSVPVEKIAAAGRQ